MCAENGHSAELFGTIKSSININAISLNYYAKCVNFGFGFANFVVWCIMPVHCADCPGLECLQEKEVIVAAER